MLQKRLTPVLLILLITITTACSTEPPRWKNVFIQAYPGDNENIFVKYGNGKYNKQKNGDNFSVELLTTEDRYRLSVSAKDFIFTNIWFDGYDNKGDDQAELPFTWKRIYQSFTSEGRLDKNPYDFYEIMLSRDKLK